MIIKLINIFLMKNLKINNKYYKNPMNRYNYLILLSKKFQGIINIRKIL